MPRPRGPILSPALLPTLALTLAPILPLLAGLAPAGTALAEEGIPRLDYEKTCASAGRAQVGLGSDQESREGCLRSEKEAYKEITKRWGEFTPAAKAQCSKQAEAGGSPSYVETVTCLELASGTVPGQGGAKAGTRTGRGGDITAEPAPSQRVDPIKVLEKP